MFSIPNLGSKLLRYSPSITRTSSWNFVNHLSQSSSLLSPSNNNERKKSTDCSECERKTPLKKDILHKFKLKIMEGTPFKWLQRKPLPSSAKIEDENEKGTEPDGKPAATMESKHLVASPPSTPGVQVTVIGADTCLGQYVSLLLKQCPAIKRLRLYETRESFGDTFNPCQRDIASIARDLQCINTRCEVKPYSCCYDELGKALQNTDIVLLLESGGIRMDLPLQQRFCDQAPTIKRYADVIARETPLSFVICCATPVECMVPLIAETLKETGWYNPHKLLGSVAVPEMRASTLAAQALCLEPWYTKVPCVGGTEGNSLVPLFSNAVEHYDFKEKSALQLTSSIRNMPAELAHNPESHVVTSTASEAYALAKLVTKVAHALMENDEQVVTGYVETDCAQVIAPTKYISSPLLINSDGIFRQLGLPKMNELEKSLLDLAAMHLAQNIEMSQDWYNKYIECTERYDTHQTYFSNSFNRKFDDCACSNV